MGREIEAWNSFNKVHFSKFENRGKARVEMG